MALLFMDGFDAADAAQKWNTVTGGISSTDTRFSVGRSYLMQGTGEYLNLTFGQKSQIFLGFALKCVSIANGRFLEIKSDSGATTHLTLAFPTPTTLDLMRGTSTVIATATLNQPLTWGTYFEISASIAEAGGTCVVKANGVTRINFTGDTKNAGTGSWVDTITIGKMTGLTSNFYIDDLYLCDGTGTAPYNTFLGDVKVHTIVPTAAGSSTQFTPSAGANYTTVDEIPYSATDYVYGTAGQTDLYAASDLPGGTGIIYGVQTNAIVKKTDAGNISARTALKSGATTYYGTTTSVGTSDQVVTRIDQTNPATASAWTSGEVNGIEIGIGAV